MLNANKSDRDKIDEAIVDVLTVTTSKQLSVVFIPFDKFYSGLKLSKLRKSLLRDEVNDALAGSTICNKFGSWIFAEYGDGHYVFVKVLNSSSAELKAQGLTSGYLSTFQNKELVLTYLPESVRNDI